MFENADGIHASPPAGLDDRQRSIAILEMAFDASFELNSNAIITAWNARAEKLFGWFRQETIGQHVQTIVSPRHREALLSNLEEVIALRTNFTPREPLAIRVLHRDGHRFSAELFFCQTGSEDNYRLTVFVRNLTDRERLHDLLSERADQRTLLNFLEDGYTELDLQGNHQWVNDAFCRTFNRTREEVLDPSYTSISHRPVSVNIRELYKRVYQTGSRCAASNMKPSLAGFARLRSL
jgi:PAS domain S-box-containing protein